MTSNSVSLSMKGDGFYDEHSQTQNVVIRQVIPLVANLAASIPSPSIDGNFCIVDYGCSEGKNSVLIVESAIKAVRLTRPNQNFLVVHEDLPANNFNRLFSQLYDGNEKTGVTAYNATEKSQVFVFASASSFYQRVMPPNSVQLGVSSSAAHWTSTRPHFSHHIFHADATVGENVVYKEAAARDWHSFLKHRAVELAPGGRLLVTLAARVLDGDKTNGGFHETHSARIIFQLLNSVLNELAAEKTIDIAAVQEFSIPIYCRSRDEILEPISKENLSASLEVEDLQIESIQCPIHAQFVLDGDAARYADGLTNIIRAITEPLLLSGLFKIKERRKSQLSLQKEQKIIDALYSRMREIIGAAPDRYTFFPCHATVIFKRRS